MIFPIADLILYLSPECVKFSKPTFFMVCSIKFYSFWYYIFLKTSTSVTWYTHRILRIIFMELHLCCIEFHLFLRGTCTTMNVIEEDYYYITVQPFLLLRIYFLFLNNCTSFTIHKSKQSIPKYADGKLNTKCYWTKKTNTFR